MNPITVLIVGQVRNQHVLMRSLQNLLVARAEGLVDRVIVATWTEEANKIAHLVPSLLAAGVTVTTADEPDPQWFVPGNLMNQMRGIDLALETVEDTAWVLRARPDLLIDLDLIASLAAADMSLPPDFAAGGAALGARIWTPFVELCQPMCLSDITYFGQYRDIVKLQNFDFFHEVARTHLQVSPGARPLTSYDAEVRRFTPAFFAAYPVLREYYRIYNKFFLGIYELRRSMLNTVYREEYYWQYMAVYFEILEKYFLIGHDAVKTPVLLVRPQDFDQAQGLGCMELTRCDYAGQALIQSPDAPGTIELFSAAPMYCARSSEVRLVAHHLQRIGAPLPRALDEAMAYRKDAARIAGLGALHQTLAATVQGGIEIGRPKIPAWHHPFGTRFIDLA
jgi:hypothetical protein